MRCSRIKIFFDSDEIKTVVDARQPMTRSRLEGKIEKIQKALDEAIAQSQQGQQQNNPGSMIRNVMSQSSQRAQAKDNDTITVNGTVHKRTVDQQIGRAHV